MLEKLNQWFRSFMTGRYGVDALNTALIVVGLVLYALAMITGLGLLSTLGFAFYILVLFRMMSRNVEKRYAENRFYLEKTGGIRTKARQGWQRFQNRKEYKYFQCPGCRTWIRLKRNTGNVTVTCKHCHTAFDQQA